MNMISTTEALAEICARFATEEFITVDTEFMRESTYWSRLCLVQVAGESEAVIIDPLAAGIDLAPFWRLMADHGVMKVFHAGRQDVEIFFHQGGVIPHPVFDTQIAAMVCGFGDQTAYEQLVRTLAKGTVDKSSRFTDWSKRPLSDKQLVYALADVTHLRIIYRKLKATLDAKERTDWVAEELAILVSPDTYEMHPETSWKRLKVRSNSRKFLGVLKELAAWREREAQSRDVPRQRVIKDDTLLEIASHAPITIEALDGLRAVPRGYAQSRYGQAVIDAVQRGLNLPPEEIPQIERNDGPPAQANGVTDMLKLLLKLKCEESGVAPKLIANTADIEAIAADDAADVPALHGWRRDVFGAAALELKRGRLFLGLENGRVKLVASDDD